MEVINKIHKTKKNTQGSSFMKNAHIKENPDHDDKVF
jgi:hypothetical protein